MFISCGGSKSIMGPLGLLVLLLIPAIGISDDVESKNNDMATAIEEQDKKVQSQSDAMVDAIEKNANLVDNHNLEEKFKKASSQVDAVMTSADDKMDSKEKETEELGNRAENAIAKHAKMVDDLADQADSRQDEQSKRVDKVGEKLFQTKQIRAKPRTTISYRVALPDEPSPGEMIVKSIAQTSWPPDTGDISEYHHSVHGSQVEAHSSGPQKSDRSGSNTDEQLRDWNLETLRTNHGKGTDRVIGSPKSAHTHIYAKVKTGWDNSLNKLHSSKLWSPVIDRKGKTDSVFHPPAHERTSLSGDHSEGRSAGLLVLPNDGQGILPDELQNQIEEDVMLRKWASQKHSQDPTLSEALNNRDSEDDIERGWVRVNGIASPEMRKPLLGKGLDRMGYQTISSMSPAQIEFLQNELPGNHD